MITTDSFESFGNNTTATKICKQIYQYWKRPHPMRCSLSQRRLKSVDRGANKTYKACGQIFGSHPYPGESIFGKKFSPARISQEEYTKVLTH